MTRGLYSSYVISFFGRGLIFGAIQGGGQDLCLGNYIKASTELLAATTKLPVTALNRPGFARDF
ncbi:hypothetical protein N9W89_10725 [Hellea sp.]|nr:hypothetical protein [Hellea sp.]